MGKKTIHGGLIIRGTLASGAGDDLLTIDPTTGEVGKISGTPLTTTLTAGSIFLGNASNVATATAVTGDVTINSSGVTAIASGVIVNADVNASAAIAHSKMAALTASRALVSDGSGVVSVASVTSTELGYVSGVTSTIQTQLNAKQATITGAATTITSSDLTANRALLSNASGKVAVSTVTNTELGYLSGVTSAIQTQFSGKLSATIAGAAEGDILYFNGSAWVNLPRGTSGYTLQSTGSSINWASATANGIAAGGTDGQVLTKQSGTDYDADWETLTVASISDITASAAELNLLDGVTATTTEINYIDGVTSNIQSQLGNKLSTTLPHHAIFVGNVSNVASTLAAGSEGQILSISSGTPTWTTISASGVTTIAALDGTTKSANGAAITGANLYLQTADDTYPGVVSTGTQTFAGAKTFSGNVSIGAGVTPNAPLQFDGGSANRKVVLGEIANDDHQYYGFGTNSGLMRYQIGEAAGNHVFYSAASSSASTELMRLTGGGDLGVGASNPAKRVDIYSIADESELRVRTDAASRVGVILSRTVQTPSTWEMYAPSGSTDLRFNNGSDRVWINASGQVGIGVSPTTTLDVNGNGLIRGDLALGHSTTAGTERSITATGSGTDVAIRYISKGSGTHVFQNAGNASSVVILPDVNGDGSVAEIHAFGGASLEIGTASATAPMIFNASNITLNASGDMAIDGTGTGVDWVATSDRRVKSNISRVDGNVLSEIGRIGELFSSYEKSGKVERGFIAQELLEVAPEYVVVPEDPEAMMAVNYSKMVALLFKGIQQLLER